MLDLHRLRVLREVGRLGSMMAAARALSYTQPAVSHHIARLESEVGTPLVVRHGRGVRLTDAGRVLAAHAEAVLARLSDAEEEVAAIAGLRRGRVRVAAFPTAAAAFLPEALVALRRRAPELEVAVTVDAEPPEALTALRRGEVDIAVVFSYDAASHGGPAGGPVADAPAGYESVGLFTEPVSIAVPAGHPVALAAGHPAATAPGVRLADLADEPWVAGCARCRANLVDACRRAGLNPRFAYTADDHLAVQRLVAHGLAVAALPALAFALHHEPGVARLPTTELSPRRVGAIAAARPRPPAVDAMLDELRAAAANARTAPGAPPPADATMTG